MATATVLKSEGNFRPNQKANLKLQNGPIKVHSPKVRLRLNEAVSNSEKMKVSTVQYNFMPPEILQKVLDNNYQTNHQNYLSEQPTNRNKICQMKDLIYGGKKEDIYDRPGSRCRGEDSQTNLERSRGILQIVGDRDGPSIPQEPAHIRCPSRAAYDNLQKARGADMNSTLHYNENMRCPAEYSTEPRNESGSMMTLLGKTQANVPRAPRCSSEAFENNRGGSMSAIMVRDAGPNFSVPAPPPKKAVVDEDGNIRDPRASVGVSGVFGASIGTPCQENASRPPRVRLGGVEFAEKNKGSISTVFGQYKQGPMPIENPVPRVRPEAEEYAQSARGNATKNLFIKYGKLPQDPKPHAHINRNSLRTAQLSRGNAMKDAICPPRMPHSKKKRTGRVHSAHR